MIVPWIQAEIISVLETGKIAVYVHHGGANSYFEACKYVGTFFLKWEMDSEYVLM